MTHNPAHADTEICAFDAAGNLLVPGRPMAIHDHATGKLARARLHRTRLPGEWMLVYEFDGRVEFRPSEWLERYAAHVPF